MNLENERAGGINHNSAEKEPEQTEGKTVEWWEFTCRTCNGKFTTNVYEPRYCLFCGASLHFK